MAPARAGAAWRQTHDDAASPWTAEAEVVLAECLLSLARSDEAMALAQQAGARLAAHPRLGEHLRRPLRLLRARMGLPRAVGTAMQTSAITPAS